MRAPGFDWEKFGVLVRCSLMGSGRLREVVAHSTYPRGSAMRLMPHPLGDPTVIWRLRTQTYFRLSLLSAEKLTERSDNRKYVCVRRLPGDETKQRSSLHYLLHCVNRMDGQKGVCLTNPTVYTLKRPTCFPRLFGISRFRTVKVKRLKSKFFNA